MESRELRVGNNIKDRGGKTLKIDYFEYDKICQKVELPFGQVGHPFTENFEFLEPIPLTEEWLLKFGFQSNEDGWYNYRVSPISITWNIYDKEVRLMGYTFSHIQYVHQLQNLYFALTNEELILR